MTTALVSPVAAAPISSGVCEVPGWGYQPDPTRLLEEKQDLGTGATEFGPVGFLPEAAIPQCLCSPLGQGDVDVQASVTNLEENGHEGWYVIEQGIMLDGEPQVEGPIAEVRSSLEHLRRVAP